VRREAILRAAQRCFANKGFSDTSVNDIAVASTLTKGGIYFHFDSKEHIRAVLIEDYTNNMLRTVDQIRSTNSPPSEKLKDIITLLLERMGEENGLLLTVAEAVTRHACSIPEIRDYYQQQGLQIAEVIVAGRQSGEFKNETEIELLAEMILTTISGLALHREMDRAGINLCTQKHQIIEYLVNLCIR